MIKKVLIANRGEASIRIIRALKELDIGAVAIYASNEKDALHVKYADEAYCVGPSNIKESYLNKEAIISVAKHTNCDAIHPGYGFLSEDYEFAKLIEDEGLIFIGPSSDTIKLMGNKLNAKKLMDDNKIGTIKGYQGTLSNLDEAYEIAREITYPIMIKNSNGGGGRGIRICHSDDDLKNAFQLARAESRGTSSTYELYMEKYIAEAKHIEAQVLADNHGNVVILSHRNCSLQRKHQKVIEEAPAYGLSDEISNQIIEQSAKIARVSNYKNAGTVEYLLDKDNNLYFMEMNTRLQVEHTVTEMITNVDIVKEQIRIANGEKLSLNQNDIAIDGHSIEVRINTENPSNNFISDFGKIDQLIFPSGYNVRIESLLYPELEISPFYDSMVAKLIIKSEDRDQAIRKMKEALDELIIEGVHTNISFLKNILNHPAYLSNQFDINFIENNLDDLIN